jgi:hypothetical protein
MPAREHQPTQRYVELMNGRYDGIRERAHDGTLLLEYDGAVWMAQVAVRERGPGRWVSGEGLTLELAVAELEKALGLPRWTG